MMNTGEPSMSLGPIVRFSSWLLIAFALVTTTSMTSAQKQLDYREGFEGEMSNWKGRAYPDAKGARLEQKKDQVRARRGRGFITISRQSEGKGYWRYDVKAVPDDAKFIRAEIQVKVRALKTKGAPLPRAWLRLQAMRFVKGKGWEIVEGGTMISRGLNGDTDWTKLELGGAMPAGAEHIGVYLMFSGSGRLDADDFRLVTAADEKSLGGLPRRRGAGLTRADEARVVRGEGDQAHPLLANSQDEKRSRVPVTLATTRGRFQATGRTHPKSAWVQVAVPRQIDRQTPLAVRVTTSPEGRVHSLEMVREAANQYLRVHLRDDWDGSPTTIYVDTAAMIAPRAPAALRRAKLTPRESLDPALLPLLGSAKGIEPEHPDIRKVAATFSRKSLGHLNEDLLAFYAKRIKAAGPPGDQGASATLKNGGAACTGRANLRASLLRAAGVPARVLSCVSVGGQLQEHYIVEAWTEQTGWVWVDGRAGSDMRDDRYVVLRRIAPETPRGAACVPIYNPTAHGTRAAFKYGETTEWRASSFSRGDLVKRSQWGGKAFRHFEKELRASLQRVQGKRIKASSLSLVGDLKMGRIRSTEAKWLKAWVKDWTK